MKMKGDVKGVDRCVKKCEEEEVDIAKKTEEGKG